MPASYCLNQRNRPYALTADVACALGIDAAAVRARARKGTFPPPTGRDGSGMHWNLRTAAEAVRRAGRPIPTAWIRALLAYP